MTSEEMKKVLKELPEEILIHEQLIRLQEFLSRLELRAVAKDKFKAHDQIKDFRFILGDIQRAIEDAIIDSAEEDHEEGIKDLARIRKEAEEIKLDLTKSIKGQLNG